MTTAQLIAHYRTVAATCPHRLWGHPPLTMQQQLVGINTEAESFAQPDV